VVLPCAQHWLGPCSSHSTRLILWCGVSGILPDPGGMVGYSLSNPMATVLESLTLRGKSVRDSVPNATQGSEPRPKYKPSGREFQSRSLAQNLFRYPILA